MYSFQAAPQAVQNNTQVKHHSEVTLNALNAEVDVEGSLDFDSTPPNVWKRKSQFFLCLYVCLFLWLKKQIINSILFLRTCPIKLNHLLSHIKRECYYEQNIWSLSPLTVKNGLRGWTRTKVPPWLRIENVWENVPPKGRTS